MTTSDSGRLWNRVFDRFGRSRSADLARRAGSLPRGARFASARRRPSRAAFDGFDMLESRVLLGADLPGLPNPWVPGGGQLITLDVNGEGSFTSNISSGSDDDLFRFVVADTDFVTILADTTGEAGSLNSRIRLYNDSGQNITPSASSAAPGHTPGDNNGRPSGLSPLTASDGWIGAVLAPGTYYVQVTGQQNTSGDYTLRIDALSTVLDPGDTDPDTGEVLFVGNINRIQGDEVIRFTAGMTAAFNSLFTATAIGEPNAPGAMDPFDARVEVYNSLGVHLNSDSNSSYLSAAFTAWKGSPTNVYFIRIRSDQLTGDAATGPYALAIDAIAKELETPMSTITRRGNDQSIQFTNPYQSSSYRFIAQGVQNRTFITGQQLNPNVAADPYLRVYDDTGRLVAFDDDYPPGGRDAQVDIQTVGGRTYFAVIDTFDPNNNANPFNPAVIALFVEAHSTTDANNSGVGGTVDDHVNIPDANLPEVVRRRLFDLATPLRVGDSRLLRDGDGNRVLDHSWVVDAVGTGRIYGSGDSDLYSFVPPVDMLGSYGGNNDDAGTALFIGGAFDIVDPAQLNNPDINDGDFRVLSRALAAWDAGDYWAVGRQQPRFNQNYFFGFNDNPTTLGTDGPEIYALYKWEDPNNTGQQILVVGGDFDLVTPFGTVERNLAAWVFNGDAWQWVTLGSANEPVRAIHAFDPVDHDDNGDADGGEVTELDFANPFSMLYIGGDFTSIGGAVDPETSAYAGGIAANFLAEFNNGNPNDATFQVNFLFNFIIGGFTGVAGLDGPVHAMEVYDPADAGSGREAQPTATPPLGAVTDPRDMPLSLFVGGAFTESLLAWTGVEMVTLAQMSSSSGPGLLPNYTITGTVFTLHTVEFPGEIGEPDEWLAIGGDFTATSSRGLAITNLAFFGRRATEDLGDLNVDTSAPAYAPRLLLEGSTNPDAVLPAANAPIFALATQEFDFGTQQGDVLFVGGAFTNIGGRVAATTGGDDWVFSFILVGDGFDDGEVRSFAIFADEQEPDALPGNGFGAEADVYLYAGGSFTSANGGDEVPFVARFNFGQGLWEALNSGPNAAVFALAEFDDNNPNQWDRNDRPAARPQIIVTPVDGSFLNTFIVIFDSNGNQIYTNATITPNPDPSGSLNPALAPGVDPALVGPALFAGVPYYIGIVSETGAFRNTGRYTVTITIEAMPPDIDGDGQPDDTISTFSEIPDAGQWTGAVPVILDDNADGDGDNFLDIEGANGTVTQGPPITPAAGNTTRRYNFPRRPTPGIGFSPSFQLATQGSDYGMIESVQDTDLYFFQANDDGYVEIRINTTNLRQKFFERIWDLEDLILNGGTANATENMITSRGTEATLISSRLDSALRIFDNDLNQIAFNSHNPAVTGEFGATVQFNTEGGGEPIRTYYGRDARVVIPVRRGETYFIQVESGQAAIFNNPDSGPDFVDWRFATGLYELIVNAIPDFDPDQDDDHSNGPIGTGTPIPIDSDIGSPTNGIGIVTGIIADTDANPNDFDLFEFIAPARGTITVTMRADAPTLAPRIVLLDQNLNEVNNNAAPAGGTASITFTGVKGERYYLAADKAAGTAGEYTITVTAPPYVDDYASVGNWPGAHELVRQNFNGLATAEGSIEDAGDTDLFVYTSETYEFARVSVISRSATLDPFVRVYEMNEDGSGNLVFLQIAFNNDSGGGSNSATSFSMTPGRPYYIVVSGANPNVHYGDYTVSVQVAATDDHPNRVNLPTATIITLVDNTINQTSTGSRAGIIEVPADDDLFRFRASFGGIATVTVTTPSSGLAPLVQLLDNNGVLLATGDNIAGTATLTFNNLISNRDYYVLVDVGTTDPDATEETGAYTVSVATEPIDDHADAGEFAMASIITLATSNGVGTRTGIIVPATDTDLFRFTTLAAGDTLIQVSTPSSVLNPRVQIFNSSFALIGTGTTIGFDLAQITISAGAAGEVYYVLVSAGTGGTPASVTGSYVVLVDGQVPGGGGGTGPIDDHANAGQWTTASNIALNGLTGNGNITGFINFAGDTDLFTFVTASAGPLFVQVTTPVGGLVDGRVRIYDAAFNQIAFDSAGIPGATADVKLANVAAGRYYALVEPTGNNTGSYTVKVDSDPSLHYLYFPEGFAGATIDEFVPIVNPNSFAVQYTIIARYETGEASSVVAQGTVPANARGGVAVVRRGQLDQALVRVGVPYSLEIVSTGQLGATFSHYDFDVSIGESFTSRTSTTWTFAEVHKDPAVYRDFVLYYNPNTVDANLTITAYYEDGTTATFNRTIPAERRKGINVNTDGAIPRTGVFGLRIQSDVPIVAAMTSYNLSNGGGDGLLGDADGGVVEGVIPSIQRGGGVQPSIAFLNTGSTTASVTVRASYSRVDLPDQTRTITVLPGRTLRLSGEALGLVDNEVAGLRFTSAQPITVQSLQYQNGDGDASTTATFAATKWIIGDAFVNPDLAGIKYFEDLSLFNPTGSGALVNIRFLFVDGTSQSTSVNVAADDFAFVSIDQQPIILNMGRPRIFSIVLESTTPFVAGFTHYDLFLNGGWGTLAAPIGLTNALSTII